MIPRFCEFCGSNEVGFIVETPDRMDWFLCLDCGIVFSVPSGHYEDFDDEDEEIIFADPGGHSALRAATKDNPRNLPCPGCGKPNKLTPADVRRHYVCDHCADAAERGY